MSKRRCGYCNDYFERDEMVVRGLSAFCSNAHYTASLNKAKPRKTPSQKRNERSGLSEAKRQEILELDGYHCRFCGKADNRLAVHHIYYRSEAKHEPWLNQQHNLITLCNYPCHLDIVHRDKKTYKPLCLQIVWLRTFDRDQTTTIQMLERQSNVD